MLPAEFQFIGPLARAVFCLQGYMGAALASVVTKDRVQQMLGGYLFVLSPVLVARLGHDTLCAQWLLLGLLYLGLREYPDDAGGRRASWLAMAAVLFAAAIHPYLTAMTLRPGARRAWRDCGARDCCRSAAPHLLCVATIAGMLTIFWAIGYFDGATVGIDRLRRLLGRPTLVDRFAGLPGMLPTARAPPEPMGGFWVSRFGWPGGRCAMAVVVLVRPAAPPAAENGSWSRRLPPLALYALSVYVTYGGHTAFKLGWLYDPLVKFTASFRASGRFIWSFHYLLLLFGIWGLTRIAGASRQAAGTTLLALAVILQATDLRPGSRGCSKKKPFRQAIDGADRRPRVGRYQHLALYPMQVHRRTSGDPTVQEDHVYRFMLQAYRMKLTYNSGLLARLSPEQVRGSVCGPRFEPSAPAISTRRPSTSPRPGHLPRSRKGRRRVRPVRWRHLLCQRGQRPRVSRAPSRRASKPRVCPRLRSGQERPGLRGNSCAR